MTTATAVRSAKTLTPTLIGVALTTQMRVLNALVLRETKTRYGNYKIGFLWALIEPIASVAVFVAIFASIRQGQPGGMPLAPFMLVGFVGYSFFRNPWGQMQGAIGASRNLLTFPQVTTFDVILARGILEILVTFFVFGFLLWMAWLLGEDIRIERPLAVLGACALLSILGVGAGFFFASLEPIMPSVKQVSAQVLGRPLFFASGLFFVVDSLPGWVAEYLMWNPVLHLVELLRSAAFYGFESLHASWFYASAWSFGMLALGLATHQAMRKKAIVSR